MMKKILVIEDDKFYSYQIKRVLESKLGYEVDIISSYKEFLVCPSLDDYKYVLLDIFLPDCDGCDIIDQLIAQKKPVLVITASEAAEIFETYNKKRVVDYIIKRDMIRLEYLIMKIKILDFLECHNVLIVEDSTSFQKYIKNFFLMFYPYSSLRFAASVPEAKEILKEDSSIRLVIADYILKGPQTGLDFVQYLREKYLFEDFGIIALTASENNNIVARFLKSGANDFLHKSFHNFEFICRIDNIIKEMIQFDEIKKMAIQDALTGCYNRYYLFDTGFKLFENLKRQKKPVSIAICDLDHFKKLNDTYGHALGDEVLRHFGAILQESLRKSDFAVRYGGEEFVLFFSNCTKESALKIVEERIRKRVREDVIKMDSQEIRYNFSCGICDSGKSLEELIKRADEKLYQAKRQRGVSVI